VRGSAEKTSVFLARLVRAFLRQRKGRSPERWLALLLSVVGAGVALPACDSYTFNGSVVAMSLLYPPPGPGMLPVILPELFHFEMWARVQTENGPETHRLYANVGSSSSPEKFPGFRIVQAIDPNDQCLIRALDRDDSDCSDLSNASAETCGSQMFSLPAQIIPEGSDASLAQLGLVLQARKVTAINTSFRAVDPTITGRAPLPLLALVQYNTDWMNDPRRRLTPINATTAADPQLSAQRLSECIEYRQSTVDPTKANPSFYVGNPRQYTKPLAGTLFGFFTFSTSSTTHPDLPNQNFSGISFSTPFSLENVDQLMITLETTQNPATPNLTQLVYQGVRQMDAMAGRGVAEFTMLFNVAINPMMPGPPTLVPFITLGTQRIPIGTAAVLTNLDSRLD
jgi:hypothetical protein